MNRTQALWMLRSLWAETDDPYAVLAIALEYGFAIREVKQWTAAEYNEEVGRLNDPPPRPATRPPSGGRWTLDHKVSKATCRKLLIAPYRCASRDNLQWLEWNENLGKGQTLREDDEMLARRWRSPRLADGSRMLL